MAPCKQVFKNEFSRDVRLQKSKFEFACLDSR